MTDRPARPNFHPERFGGTVSKRAAAALKRIDDLLHSYGSMAKIPTELTMFKTYYDELDRWLQKASEGCCSLETHNYASVRLLRGL